MYDAILNFTFDYYWIPLVIGMVSMFWVSYNDPESRVKYLVFWQFVIVMVASKLLDAITSGMTHEQMVDAIPATLIFSSIIQLPIAGWVAKKYIDSNRAIVLIIATILSIICNTILLCQMKFGWPEILHVYNQAQFLINCFAIGSCHKGFSYAVARVVFGGNRSRRQNYRRVLVHRSVEGRKA